MFGSIDTRGPGLEQLGEQYLEAAEDEIDIHFTGLFDAVVETSLPDRVPAAMRRSRQGYLYDRVELLLDEEFKDLYSNEKMNAMIHEGIHGLAARDKLDEVLVEHGIPGEDARRIDTLIDESPEAVMEGLVQSIADAFDPEEGGRYFRPTERYMAQTVLQQEGIDLESELDENRIPSAEGYADHDIYDVDIEPSLYDGRDDLGIDAVWSPSYGDGVLYAGEEPVYDPGRYAS